MSTVLPPPPAPRAPAVLNVSGTPAVPFWRLCLVELRKSYDTRAGFWLMFAIGLIVSILQVITLIAVNVQDLQASFEDFTGNPWLISLVLMPMIPILLVTTEWSQRTAMVSFSLEPRRMRVVLAKLVASIVIALATFVLILLVAAACTAICDVLQPDLTEWSVSEGAFVFVGQPVTLLVTTVFGWAVAAMLLNTPAAIVLFIVGWYLFPLILGALTGLLPFLEDAFLWVALQVNALTLADGLPDDAEAWGQLLFSFGLWIVLPTVLGSLRIVRAEVK